MKKNLAFLLALLMLVLVGCSSGGGEGTPSPSAPVGTDSVSTTEPTTEPTAEPTDEPTDEPAAGDHVVDYKFDVPEGFEETDPSEIGVTACWYRADGSNINLNITEKDSTTDLGFKAITGDMLRTTLEEQLKQSYGEATIEDRYFTKDDVCGLPAYQYCYDLDLDGTSMSQIIICINADQTYTFTFTASDDETLALFEDTVKTINLTLE